MSRRTLIADAWIDYMHKVLPGNASKVQISETRRAFYAGALSLFEAIGSGLSPGSDVEQTDLRMLDDIAVELRTWLADSLREARHARRLRS